MQPLVPLRDVKPDSGFKKNDVLVVFGEVFARGYVNGLIDEAKTAGLKVIYGTVGRRDSEDQLRPLNAEELAQKDQPLINVPLECGFDLSPSSKGLTPCDQLKGIKLSDAPNATLDFRQVEESRKSGRENFRARVQQYLVELEKHIPKGSNVLFAHTMAGGVPRAKVILPVMNRVFKGQGERYSSSKTFWESHLGQFCAQSFMDVTANSLEDLIDLSSALRGRIESAGGKTSYVAYGYHGTEILIENEYRWQSYAPYLQGFAKMGLEEIAVRESKKGVKVCIFNAPEILTNSSSIFMGVEVALYPLLGAFKKEAPNHPFTQKLLADCRNSLKPDVSIEDVLAVTESYFRSDIMGKKWAQYEKWPQHNGPEQMELMKTSSDKIISMHHDERALLTVALSETVFRACGKAMFHEAMAPRQPVCWVGHDLVVKLSLNQMDQ